MPLTERHNAVFLSYATQDADAAQRLCQALRGAGIEVWLDRSELRGGDAWDQRIRREIRDCALFIPIISSNTQARLEGYFRREWKLAVARTLDMSDDKAFLMPVVIDDTRDQDAHVPDKFRELQWTSLLGGETSPTFLELIQRLLSPDANHSTQVTATSGGLIAHNTQPTYGAPLPIPEKSIAVIPFADISAQKDQEYFSDGMTEALIDLLTQVRDLRVPARTSSFSFKGRSEDIASIARKLRVTHILEGSVRKAGSAIKVTVHLIRADDGYHLWSRTYDRDIEDVFKVQDEIAGLVVEALKARLLPPQGVINLHRTSNIEAYEQYLLAKQFHYYRRDADSPQRGLSALTKALTLDPGYASAHALLAISLTDQIMVGTAPFAANAPLAIEAAQKAVVLAPGLGEAYSARSFVRSNLQWDWNGAQADIETALRLDPRSETTQRRFGILLASMGRIPEALAAAQAATAIEPLDVTSWSLLGLCYSAAGRFDDGQRALKRGLGLSPDSIMLTLYLSMAELATGQTLEALKTNSRQQFEPWQWSIIIAAEYALGHLEESHKVMHRMIDKYRHRTPFAIAVAYAWCRQIDQAFEWLERACQQRDAGIALLQATVGLSELRKDLRYKELLRKMHFPG